MASQGLTEYERKRLENIKRNDEMLASLNVHSKLADLSASTKRHWETKIYNVKAKSETPVVIRQSLRTQGKEPDCQGLGDYLTERPSKIAKLKSQVILDKFSRELKPLGMKDVCVTSEPDERLVKKILSVSKKGVGSKVRASIDLESMELMPENIARVMPGRILSVKFLPSADVRMVAVGNINGNLGFWNFDSEIKDGGGVYMYHPHPAYLSSICIQPFAVNKIITSCYHGFVRTLDIQKETFDLTYHGEHAIFCMSHRSDDVNSLYLGEGSGLLRAWDGRSRSSSMPWNLRCGRINTIDFNPENTNIMATSSSYGSACIWDLRKLPHPLKKIACHRRAIYSAYFSPSGNLLATTSRDKIGVVSGPNYDDEFLLYHNNQVGGGSWSQFRGVWGWDDSYVYMGNVKGGIDAISTKEKRVVTTLESPYMTEVPCRFDAHPFKAGMLAGATSVGKVYIWSL